MSSAYDEQRRRGRAIYAPTRIGSPGRGWAYWPLFVLAQVLRFRWRIRVSGRQHIGHGSGILIGNHLSLLDPVMAGVSLPRHLSFFTKIEVFERPGALFFRSTGQIPLRRGDEEATGWALEMSGLVVAEGRKLAIYPEGTRSPDGVTLHRLHRRVLIPILQANPGVPVHVMTVAYGPRSRGRITVDLRFSPALDLDPASRDAEELTLAVRDALLELGGMPYEHTFGRSIKGTSS